MEAGPNFIADSPQGSRERAFAFSPEERRVYYAKYLSESLERDFPERQRREMGRLYDFLQKGLDVLDARESSGNFRERLVDAALGFADCIVSSKVRTNQVFDEFGRWTGEQQSCHQNVQDIIREVSEQIGKTKAISDETKVVMRKLAEEEHIFFNSFALFVAYTEVVVSVDKR